MIVCCKVEVSFIGCDAGALKCVVCVFDSFSQLGQLVAVSDFAQHLVFLPPLPLPLVRLGMMTSNENDAQFIRAPLPILCMVLRFGGFVNSCPQCHHRKRAG